MDVTVTDDGGVDYQFDLVITYKIAPAEPDVGISDDYVDYAEIQSGIVVISDYDNDTEVEHTVDADNLHLPDHLEKEFWAKLEGLCMEEANEQ